MDKRSAPSRIRTCAHGSGGGGSHLSNLCILPAWTRWLISPAAETIPRIFQIMDTSAVTDRTLQGMARVRCNPAAAATIDLRLIVTASAVQPDPAHEADARFFESDRGCWKAGLRSAGLTNARGRRPSAPLRKVIESPVQCGGQAGCRVFLRHISIMRLLSLGYENYDDCLCGFKLSFIMALTSAGSRRKADSGALHLPRLSLSRPVACTNPCTNPVPDLPVPLRPIPEGPRHGSGRLGRNAARGRRFYRPPWLKSAAGL